MPASRVLPLTVAAALLVGAHPALAERGDDSARKSKNGAVSGTVGGVAVQLSFGRPEVRGRAIWGALVPFGKVWRTGADEATTIAFDRDVTVEGKPLSAGTYALFTVPGEERWEVIFNLQAEQWGAFGHDPSKDALRVTVTPERAEHTEALDFVLGEGRVALRWETLAVPFAVQAAAP